MCRSCIAHVWTRCSPGLHSISLHTCSGYKLCPAYIACEGACFQVFSKLHQLRCPSVSSCPFSLHLVHGFWSSWLLVSCCTFAVRLFSSVLPPRRPDRPYQHAPHSFLSRFLPDLYLACVCSRCSEAMLYVQQMFVVISRGELHLMRVGFHSFSPPTTMSA